VASLRSAREYRRAFHIYRSLARRDYSSANLKA